MSKGFNMIGWRLGWVCGHPRIVQALADVKDNSDSGQFIAIQKRRDRGPRRRRRFPARTREKYRRRLEKLVATLRRCGFTCDDARRHVLPLHAGATRHGRRPAVRQRRGREPVPDPPSSRSSPCRGTTPGRICASPSPTRPPTSAPRTPSWRRRRSGCERAACSSDTSRARCARPASSWRWSSLRSRSSAPHRAPTRSVPTTTRPRRTSIASHPRAP